MHHRTACCFSSRLLASTCEYQCLLKSNYSKLNDTRKNKLLATSETLLAEEQGKTIDINEKRAEYDDRKRISLSVPGKVSAGTGYWQEDDYDTVSVSKTDIYSWKFLE